MAENVLITLVRVLLPFTFIFASLARPVGVSILYLGMFFGTPWLMRNKSKKQRSILTIYLIVSIIFGGLFSFCHLALNFMNFLFSILKRDILLANILRQVGFIDFTGLRAISVLHWILPDIMVTLVALIILVFMKVTDKMLLVKLRVFKLSNHKLTDGPKDSMKYSELNRLLIMAYIKSFLRTSPIFSLICLFFAATLRPSVPGFLYFLVFIVAGTYWALYRQVSSGFKYLFGPIIVVLQLQIISFLLFQLPIVNVFLNSNTFWPRMMGLEVVLFLHDHNRHGAVLEINNNLHFDSFLSPIALMCTYFIIILNIVQYGQEKLMFSTMRMEIGQKTDQELPDESNRPKSASINIEEPSTLEQFFYMICDVTSYIYKNSYILLNIIMMIWSIIYHSWLTFVLLIWANILWMIPNQRRSMMQSSFFVVVYAEFLIIIQYIYGLNLIELPSNVNGINVAQIGLVHPQNRGLQPCVPLAVKTSFLFIFWITSHQYFKEKAENKADDDLLQHLFGAQHSRSDSTFFEKSRTHRAIIFLFECVSNFITRIWMWMLIILIFLCAMIDNFMTGFRICYMSLFLLFLMVFQMSLQLWIQFLFGYWMFVIFYAMTMLIVIYTYQFDYFDHYWEKYLRVQPTLQSDIGLRRYRTKDLFLHLLVPTLTVIFTVIQLHYFHRRFMRAVLHPGLSSRRRTFSRTQYKRQSSIKGQSWTSIFIIGYRKLRSTFHRWFPPSKQFAWRFLEMHMIKAVNFATFICAISEICCFNLLLVILALMSVCVNRVMRRIISRIVTFWISVLILMKMIYQIKYLDETHYDYTCDNYTVNFADWMGLRKTDQSWGSLLRYVAPYIVYMIVTTLHAVVKLRDHLIRYSLREVKNRTTLFPTTSRQDAERSFSCLLKYILNYGYFKFGLEITFIALVSSIANRLDILAVTYVIWLIILLILNRRKCARIWYMFQLYFVLSIFVQYVYIIHFPPNLCLASAKIVDRFKDIRPFSDILDEKTKANLLMDFIVLLFIARQRKAFKAEVREMNNLAYAGGDNRNVVHNIAKLGHVYFKNPTHDFCSFVRNYSDVFKTVVFCSFLWITLAIVFMGGVCSMDMLSLGYLIFSLVFLLQGSEVYLENIHYIICRWNFLIGFNVFNILIKVCIIVFAKIFDIKQKQDYQSLFAVLKYDMNQPNPDGSKQPDDEIKYHYGPNNLIFDNILTWHVIIFAFVIFQSRIFRSYYFCHIILDTKANTVLASRGAIIIENLYYKQIYDRREYEKNMLENVKNKMEIIRANNVKNYTTKAHDVVTKDQTVQFKSRLVETESNGEMPITSTTLRNLNLARSSPLKRRDMRLHPHAVRSGDYYMFGNQDESDEQMLKEEYDFLEMEELRTRQILISAKNKKAQNNLGPNLGNNSQFSSDSDIDFDTNPIIKLTSELIMLVTLRLNRLSRNFRFVHKVLSAEKKTLQDISTMNRLGMVNTAAMFSFLNQSLYDKQIDSINPPTKESILDLVNKGADFTALEHNDFVQMLISLWYAIIANTEVISYLTVFINQAANSSIISLPMPFLVLYWGALTLPRPTKTFWVTLITYTLGVIFLKCILHQKIVLDQKLIKMAKTMDFELFIKHGKAVYDLLLLVVLFWHRYMLKKQGIWNIPRSDSYPVGKSRNKQRPSDILRRLREESGSELRDRINHRADSSEFERDMDDLLRPGVENKYIYENIESEYYRTAMKSLERNGGLYSNIKKFFIALLHKARLSTDVYTLLFICDFTNFFVLLFGFPRFVYRHKHSTSVLETYIQGNKVPFSFLFMLIVQFFTIVTERAIYLRKAIKAKIVFHFFTVLGIHIWMFFAVPYVTAHSFGATAPAIFYLIKCLHMLLSAYQICCGYPKRILGNVFTKSYSMVNYVAFKVYMEIPFLYILRTLLDWLCIDTTLTIMEWIKMEDIFQSVFIVRCYRQMDTDLPVMRGEPKALYAKCLIGGTIIMILIALIWSPLFLFALVGTVGQPNVPRRADISLKIGHYEPVYVSQSYSGIHQFSKKNYRALVDSFSHDIYSSDHIRIYDSVDVTAVKFNDNSVTLWNMSPPDKKRLLADLKSGKPMDIRLRLSFNTGSMSDTVMHETTYTLTKNKEQTREMLIKTLTDPNSKARVIVPDILPKFLTVQKTVVFVKFIKDYEGKHNRPIILQKKRADGKSWWDMHDFCDDKYYRNVLINLPMSNCDEGIVFYIFFDKSFPSAMSFLEKTGIIGLYTTCVYVVSRVIRSLIANNHRRIMFEDLPFVDRILKLCNDIYLVRETKEYRLEEDLYAKLIFLYRSPETLIKWTRYKEDNVENPTASESNREATSERSANDDGDDDDDDNDNAQRRAPRFNQPPA